MKGRVVATVSVGVLSSLVAIAQSQVPRLPAKPANAPAPSLQATADPGYEALTKTCKTPPAGRGRGGAGGRGAAGGRGPAPAAGVRDVKSDAIPGVIAAGQTWKFLWQEEGNNGDGIVGTNDGGLLLAQNDNSKVVKLDKNGKPKVVYAETHTGGALSQNSKKQLFIVERGLHNRIEQLEPQRKVFADKYNGEPLDCIGGVINDITAASNGGVYFTMGGVYYANPKGEITKYGENITPNGIVLSSDEKTLYVTNGTTMAAFDVQPDGSLKNQREFGQLGAGGGDGSTIDSMGRVYVTYSEGIAVLSPEGKKLGTIPTPRGVITAAFGGKDKKMLYILARGAEAADGTQVANAAQVWVIPMVAQGFKGRAK
jgi:sugar lactone lactonase YvrE